MSGLVTTRDEFANAQVAMALTAMDRRLKKWVEAWPNARTLGHEDMWFETVGKILDRGANACLAAHAFRDTPPPNLGRHIITIRTTGAVVDQEEWTFYA